MQHQISNQKCSVFPTYMQSMHYRVMAAAFFVTMMFIDAVPRYASLTNMHLGHIGDLLRHMIATLFLTVLVYFSIADRPVRRALKALLVIVLLMALEKAIQIFLYHGTVDGSGLVADAIAATICVLMLNLIQTFRVVRTKK